MLSGLLLSNIAFRTFSKEKIITDNFVLCSTLFLINGFGGKQRTYYVNEKRNVT